MESRFFPAYGYKLPDARELAIEKEIFALLQADAVPPLDTYSRDGRGIPGDENSAPSLTCAGFGGQRFHRVERDFV